MTALRPTLDAFPANIAILDDRGRIRFVNAAWRTFSEQNGAPADAVSEGINYLEICDQASGASSEGAREFGQGIREVRAGEKSIHTLKYPCHSPDKKRWFIGSAVPFPSPGGMHVMVVHVDITAIRQMEKSLQESNLELSEYAYALTHSLKEPVRAIYNYIDFILEDLADELGETPRKYLHGIKNAVTQSKKYFEDLEVLYNIRNSTLNVKSFDMAQLLKEIESALVSAPHFKLKTAGRWPPFRSGRFHLRQILIHLIQNGLKFNRSPVKQVDVGWQSAAGDQIEIFVRDNGIGIAPEYHEQIFHIFRRLHTQREYEGTGIGLAIVKRAVQHLNGTIHLESELEKGSTFTIRLPKSIVD